MDELKKAASKIGKARSDLQVAMNAAKDAAIAAHADGVTEVEIAVNLGVNRMTIRKWLGK
jgi:predicted transcriptional regulator